MIMFKSIVLYHNCKNPFIKIKNPGRGPPRYISAVEISQYIQGLKFTDVLTCSLSGLNCCAGFLLINLLNKGFGPNSYKLTNV